MEGVQSRLNVRSKFQDVGHLKASPPIPLYFLCSATSKQLQLPGTQMALSLEGKPAGSTEEYDMGRTGVEHIQGDALGGTSHDALDMYRMGKKQELRVGSSGTPPGGFH